MFNPSSPHLFADAIAKAELAQHLKTVHAWYDDFHMLPQPEHKGPRQAGYVREATVLCELDSSSNDWQHYLHTARGMLAQLLGDDEEARVMYTSALEKLNALDGEYLSLHEAWLNARLADLAEKQARWQDAEVHLEWLDDFVADGDEKYLAVVFDEMQESGVEAYLTLRLIRVYMAQDKFSRYAKAERCWDDLEGMGVELTDEMKEQAALCRRYVRMADE